MSSSLLALVGAQYKPEAAVDKGDTAASTSAGGKRGEGEGAGAGSVEDAAEIGAPKPLGKVVPGKGQGRDRSLGQAKSGAQSKSGRLGGKGD